MESTMINKEEFLSLNSEISEFSLQELEQRLETDPLAIGGLLDVTSVSDNTLLSAHATGCDFSCGWYF